MNWSMCCLGPESIHVWFEVGPVDLGQNSFCLIQSQFWLSKPSFEQWPKTWLITYYRLYMVKLLIGFLGMVTRNGIWESRSQPAAVSNTQSKGERLWVAQRKPKEYKREVTWWLIPRIPSSSKIRWYFNFRLSQDTSNTSGLSRLNSLITRDIPDITYDSWEPPSTWDRGIFPSSQ